jgi:hypothetical protein
MGATDGQSNWPEMRKTLGKPLVLQRRGQEPNFWVFFQWFWGVREVVVGDWNTPQKSDWWAFCLD